MLNEHSLDDSGCGDSRRPTLDWDLAGADCEQAKAWPMDSDTLHATLQRPPKPMLSPAPGDVLDDVGNEPTSPMVIRSIGHPWGDPRPAVRNPTLRRPRPFPPVHRDIVLKSADQRNTRV